MDRRKFLQRLGIGVATVAVAPKAIEAVCSCEGGFKPLIGTAEEWCNVHGTPLVECSPTVKEYGDYTNFSQFANCEQIDDVVMKAAEELGRSAGEEIARLGNYAFLSDTREVGHA